MWREMGHLGGKFTKWGQINEGAEQGVAWRAWRGGVGYTTLRDTQLNQSTHLGAGLFVSRCRPVGAECMVAALAAQVGQVPQRDV